MLERSAQYEWSAFLGATRRWWSGVCLAGAVGAMMGCQTRSAPSPDSNAQTAVASTRATAAPGATALASSANATPSKLDARFVGSWKGQGAASAVKLALPGDQGVQLAWVQDKGTSFVGPVSVSLTVNSDGKIGGDVTGSLGQLLVVGDWDGLGVLHAKLTAASQTQEAFNGTLTAPVSRDASFAEVLLRVTSNDGRWVRQASVPLQPTNR